MRRVDVVVIVLYAAWNFPFAFFLAEGRAAPRRAQPPEIPNLACNFKPLASFYDCLLLLLLFPESRAYLYLHCEKEEEREGVGNG